MSVAAPNPDTWDDDTLLRALALVEAKGWKAAAAELGCESRALFAVVSAIHADLAQSEGAKC